MQNDADFSSKGVDAQLVYFKSIKIAVQVLGNTPSHELQWRVAGLGTLVEKVLGDDWAPGEKDLQKRRATFIDSLRDPSDLERSQNLGQSGENTYGRPIRCGLKVAGSLVRLPSTIPA